MKIQVPRFSERFQVITGQKLQIPRTKLQRTSKVQTSSGDGRFQEAGNFPPSQWQAG
jgi:hypothetical protein